MKTRHALPLLVAAACGSGTTQGPTTTVPPPPATGSAMGSAVAVAPPVDDMLPMPKSTKPVTTKSLKDVGLDASIMDRSVDPCDDFFEFACGNYVKNTVIPDDKPIAMRSFVDISDRNLEYLHGILDTARTNPGKDALMQKVGAFYGSCLDVDTADKLGIKPIQPWLNKIKTIKDPASLAAVIIALHAEGASPLFGAGSTQDDANATKVIAIVAQGGLGMPEKDYYLKDDEASKKLRDTYQAYIAQNLVAAGYKEADATKSAADVMALETALAKASKGRVEMRDAKGRYNKIDRAGLVKSMPHFPWDKYFAAVGQPKLQDVTVTSPDFLTAVDGLMVSIKPDVWRAYLTANLVKSTSTELTKSLDEAAFKYNQNFSGAKEQEPRWKRCVRRTDQALGELLGQIFVRDRFAGDSKKAAEEDVHAIVSAMSDNINGLSWMDAQTKAKAQEKLASVAYQIGYPKKWREYNFKVDAKTFAANIFAANKAENLRDWAKIGKPVDKDEWGMSPPTVNAYYSPNLNEMVFPAGILQPPFYSIDASIPVNLGGMGVVVGHELTHGFDDEGANYDAEGNLKSWWQPDTEKLFKGKTQCVIDQYAKYQISGVNLNGAGTVGENVADIGGVKLALSAYRTLRAPAKDTVVADGFTEDQQFFLGFGQAWCAKARPEFEKMRAATDPHSPARWRVDGALSATPEFSRVWSCKKSSKMRPANACVVW
jgi:predicted metalloendopeptidase